VFDANSQRMVVFGGRDQSSMPTDRLYFLGLPTLGAPLWAQAPFSSVPGRWEHAAVYDPLTDYMFLFGGRDVREAKSDTWALGLGTRQGWDEIEGRRPPARWGHALVMDADRRRAILFGGARDLDATQVMSDTWVLDISEWPARARWAQADLGPGPEARFDHVAAIDPLAAVMIVHGGLTGGAAGRELNDTWMLDLEVPRWTRLDVGDAAPALAGHSAVWDAAGRVIVVGGWRDGSVQPDVYALRRRYPTSTSTPTPTATPTETPPAPKTLVLADFESPDWYTDGPWSGVEDRTASRDGVFHWGRRPDCTSAGSSNHLLWAVGAGVDGDRLPCGDNYPNGAESALLMELDLRRFGSSSRLDLVFDLWIETEPLQRGADPPMRDGLALLVQFYNPKGLPRAEVYEMAAFAERAAAWRRDVRVNLGSARDSFGRPLELLGQRVRLTWLFSSDGFRNYPIGVMLDNVRLEGDLPDEPTATDVPRPTWTPRRPTGTATPSPTSPATVDPLPSATGGLTQATQTEVLERTHVYFPWLQRGAPDQPTGGSPTIEPSPTLRPWPSVIRYPIRLSGSFTWSACGRTPATS
jgi:hypothetical protein